MREIVGLQRWPCYQKDKPYLGNAHTEARKEKTESEIPMPTNGHEDSQANADGFDVHDAHLHLTCVREALQGYAEVAGLSPAQASAKIEGAFKTAKILVDPHVTLTVAQSRSQRVSVLGQVGTPGRYPIESNTSVVDLLAPAGGVTVPPTSRITLPIVARRSTS